MQRPSHPLDLIVLIVHGEAYKLWQPSATSSFPDPNIIISTLFSNTHNLCPSASILRQILSAVFSELHENQLLPDIIQNRKQRNCNWPEIWGFHGGKD